MLGKIDSRSIMALKFSVKASQATLVILRAKNLIRSFWIGTFGHPATMTDVSSSPTSTPSRIPALSFTLLKWIWKPQNVFIAIFTPFPLSFSFLIMQLWIARKNQAGKALTVALVAIFEADFDRYKK